MSLPPGFQDFLDALEGVAYAVNPAGVILAVGQPAWRRFAERNKGDAIAEPRNLVGQSLLDLINGDDVRGFYRTCLDKLCKGRAAKPLAVAFRCDAPDVQREMRLAMTSLRFGGPPAGVLFQAITWHESRRPALALYDFAGLREKLSEIASLPTLTMCSFCQRVRYPAGSARRSGAWVEAPEYYRLGGNEEVAIAHGICPACKRRHSLKVASRTGSLN